MAEVYEGYGESYGERGYQPRYPLRVPETVLDGTEAEEFLHQHSTMSAREASLALRALSMGDEPSLTWQVLGSVWATLTWVPLERGDHTGNGYKAGVEIRRPAEGEGEGS